MNFLEFYNDLEYFFGENIDSDDVEIAYKMAKKYNISVLSDKEIYCIIKDDGIVVGSLWSAWSSEEFSFDIVINVKYQGRGFAKKLVDIAIQEYNESKEAYDRGEGTIIRTDCVNPKMVQILLGKGFKVENDSPGHTIMIRESFDTEMSLEDLVVGDTIYHVDEVDEEEYNSMKKHVERAIKDNKRAEELLKIRYIDSDTKKIKDSINANKKFIKHWQVVGPWMICVLKNKGININESFDTEIKSDEHDWESNSYKKSIERW